MPYAFSYDIHNFDFDVSLYSIHVMRKVGQISHPSVLDN